MTLLLEQERNNRRNKNLLLLAGLLITLLRLFFFGERGLIHTDSVHDDLLFLRQAYTLIHGDWLGPYNHMTLAKAPGYSFFCALALLTGLPYYLFLDLVLCLSALLCCQAIKPILRSGLSRLFFYTFLILNPFILFMQRLFIQDFFVITLWLFVFSLAGILLRIFRERGNSWSILPWCISTGAALLFCSLLREEGLALPWIYILFAGMLLFCLIRYKKHWIKPGLLLLVPLLLYGCGNLAISIANYKVYGYFGVCERRDPLYKKAMGTILGIAHSIDPEWDPRIPVKYKVLDKLYKASPAFELLSTKTNLSRGYFWTTWSNTRFPPKILKEKPELAENIKGGFFQWAFLGALEEAGFYQDRKTLVAYYNRLNKELEEAIQSGQILSRAGVRTSSLPPYDPSIVSFFFQKLFREIPKILFWEPQALLHRIRLHVSSSSIPDTRRLFSLMNEDHDTRYDAPVTEIYGWGHSGRGVPLTLLNFQDKKCYVEFYPHKRMDVAESMSREWQIPLHQMPELGFFLRVKGTPRIQFKDPGTGKIHYIDYAVWSKGYQHPNYQVYIDTKTTFAPAPSNRVPVFKRKTTNEYLKFIPKLSLFFFGIVSLAFVLLVWGIYRKRNIGGNLVRETTTLLTFLLLAGVALFYFLTIILANVYLHCPRYPSYYIPSSSVYWTLIALSFVILFQKGKGWFRRYRNKRSRIA